MMSLLMSVYKNDLPEYLDAAFLSIQYQTVVPKEIILVRDGPISSDLEDVIYKYERSLRIREIKLSENLGLPIALNYGLESVTQPWVVRFDADDINEHDRFEQQLKVIGSNCFDLFGGQIAEFDCDPKRVIGYRYVPLNHCDIISTAKYRNPFNHMTVCMRRDLLRKVGGYPNLRFMQDYKLWLQMMISGARCMNLDSVLVRARVDGLKMYRRRFNFEVIRNEIDVRKYIYTKKLDSGIRQLLIGMSRLFLLSTPALIKRYMYLKMLRRAESKRGCGGL
jgi:glycosyltransferase involved in cell wall biosynthesis